MNTAYKIMMWLTYICISTCMLFFIIVALLLIFDALGKVQGG